MANTSTEYKFPNATEIISATFEKMKSAPTKYQFMLDVIENDILNQDTINQMDKVFDAVIYEDYNHMRSVFTGHEMNYFLENFMIPVAIESSTLTWPLNLVFSEPVENNYTVYIYTKHDIIMYDGYAGRHEFNVIPLTV